MSPRLTIDDFRYQGHFIIRESKLTAIAKMARRPHGWREKVARLDPIATTYGIHCAENTCTKPGIMSLDDLDLSYQANPHPDEIRVAESLMRRWFCLDHVLLVQGLLRKLGMYAGLEDNVSNFQFRQVRQDLFRPCGHSVEYDRDLKLKPCYECRKSTAGHTTYTLE